MNGNGDIPYDEEEQPEGEQPDKINPLAWIDQDDPRRAGFPDEWTTPPRSGAGHSLCGPRCHGRTQAGARCKAPATVVYEGAVYCKSHTPSAGPKPHRAGSLRNRLKASVDENWDAVESQLLDLATGAMTEKSFSCTACRKKNVVTVVDAATRLRASTELLSRTGAHAQSAASKIDEEMESRDISFEKVQVMSYTELIALRSYQVASSPTLLQHGLDELRDFEQARADNPKNPLGLALARNSMNERTMRDVYEALKSYFEPDTIAA